MNKKIIVAIAVVMAVFLIYFFTGNLQNNLREEKERQSTAGVSGPAVASPDVPRAEAPFHIGVMTGGGAQSLDNLLGAKEALKLYGDAAKGGMIRHVTYPDNFMTDMETTINRLEELAGDPLMKVIVVNQAVQGTAEAFRTIRRKRPDILCLAAENHEDLNVISSVADLVTGTEFLARGYVIPLAAKELGAKTLVHISFPRHMMYENLKLKRDIMEEACNDLGLKFIFENVPDPLGDSGVEGARRYIVDTFPKWIEKYGPDTAFFCTNDSQTLPLLTEVAKVGGFFVEADVPSPLMGYPEAFGVDVNGDIGNWSTIIRKLEDAVVKAGAGGRMGTWAYSTGYCTTMALVEFGKLVTEGKVSLKDTNTLLQCLKKFSSGAEWSGNHYYAPPAGKRMDNVFFVYQDIYIFGKGYMGTTSISVPEKYYKKGVAQESAEKTATKEETGIHIGIVTGDSSQSVDDWLGGLEFVRRYGSVEEGGLVRHLIYANDFMEKKDNTTALIAGLADDPLMKVIVINQAVPGTAEALKLIKSRRPDIVCLAGEIHESLDEVAPFADLVLTSDNISRGYLIPYMAKSLGAKTFVHISFSRHMGYAHLKRGFNIMQTACEELGISFVPEEAPDPTGPEGIEGAAEFILNIFPEWAQKYGPDTVYFCTNDAHTAPVLQGVAKWGGYFVEAELPSPLMGYPEAFNVDVSDDMGDWPGILSRVEKAVLTAGGGGRMGTWTYSLGYCQTAGLAEFGKRIVEGSANIADTRMLLDCFEIYSPGAKWNGTYYTDSITGKPMRNYFLVYQDTYIFGKGYMNATSVAIPEKFLFVQ
ncbi:MAG: DUF3798 domain-containing protein [Synergistaceae bacterium]|jgi:DNA-binding LacI/PurR family transcriptional regulator|nr:DUF3798 domain-containing protein [Synergistaceae bacterium]